MWPSVYTHAYIFSLLMNLMKTIDAVVQCSALLLPLRKRQDCIFCVFYLYGVADVKNGSEDASAIIIWCIAQIKTFVCPRDQSTERANKRTKRDRNEESCNYHWRQSKTNHYKWNRLFKCKSLVFFFRATHYNAMEINWMYCRRLNWQMVICAF